MTTQGCVMTWMAIMYRLKRRKFNIMTRCFHMTKSPLCVFATNAKLWCTIDYKIMN